MWPADDRPDSVAAVGARVSTGWACSQCYRTSGWQEHAHSPSPAKGTCSQDKRNPCEPSTTKGGTTVSPTLALTSSDGEERVTQVVHQPCDLAEWSKTPVPLRRLPIVRFGPL
eukprot:TRINITY_DN61155_c0_g1_i1.p1 TRINITY_DN61155_c0_g1~~TRINITY_DN61155_c0_g1_i1.p1  ORF type:complete len:113 (+),score=4.71 TRINITY_DN61155_c0_g1_i1:89-427(+)